MPRASGAKPERLDNYLSGSDLGQPSLPDNAQPTAPDARPLVGRLVARGLSDELKDRHYLVVDGTNGRAHYVEIGRGMATAPIPDGAVVAIAPRPVEPRRSHGGADRRRV